MDHVRNQDADHLRLLGIFHFVVAALAFLFAMFPIFHMILGVAMLSGGLDASGGEGAPRFIGWFFVLFSGAWIVVGIVFAVALVVAGRALLVHRHYTFCLAMAGISCAFMPFGTVLGVFTILVLMRDSVKQLFGGSFEEKPAGP